ncbi:MAG: hypothetical protein AAF252_01520 [Pseudomonadota bacterium]
MERSSVTFLKLNNGWDAEPNAPYPRVAQDGSTLYLRFWNDNFVEPKRVVISFEEVSCFRFTGVNDEGWNRGQCRFSHQAPAWGDFYLVDGDQGDGRFYAPWTSMGVSSCSDQHFLYYFRDETFECKAKRWAMCGAIPEHVVFSKPRVELNAFQKLDFLKSCPFRARIADAFLLKEKGLVLQLTDIEGMPVEGQEVFFGDTGSRVIALGTNGTDKQPVSFRDCLTGQTVPAYGSILVEASQSMDITNLHGIEIKGGDSSNV